jgi:(2Fe-2S) ferredoxin
VKRKELETLAAKYEIGNHSRHIFLCVGDKCCHHKEGEAAWEVLKKTLKQLHKSTDIEVKPCARTKVGCLRICEQGPILLVYPDGTYYAEMTAQRISRFVEEHIINNRPIEEWIFARNPLSTPPNTDSFLSPDHSD